ncbi:MAG: hypothetical protein PF542_01425 [Nanoarchaeota archaeon]|jgi:predicted transcriptional regulator|nr:hypothetical protein [Nanoarchaeota archaeon]
MVRTKTREVTIREEGGSFNLFGNEKKIDKDAYDFDGLDSFRKLLSKEKARMMDTIKYKKPRSIYELAKVLGRPFKAVSDDIKLLTRFGIIELIAEKSENRTRHRPVIIIDHLIIHLKI